MTAVSITDTSTATIHALVRKEIQQIIATDLSLRDAIHLYRRSIALVIAEDAIHGQKQWAPRLEKFRYATQLEEAVMHDPAGYADLRALEEAT